MSKYTPRRATSRWLEGAPSFIFDCFGDPRTMDRYTILFGGPDWTEGDGTRAGTWFHYLGCSEGGRGFSQWGEMSAANLSRYRYREAKRRVRWLGIPEETRKHILARAAES